MQRIGSVPKLLGCALVAASVFSCGKEADSNPKAQAAVTQPSPKPRSQLSASAKQPAPNVQNDKQENANPLFSVSQGVKSQNGVFYARVLSWQSGPQVTEDESLRNSFVIEIADAQLQAPNELTDFKVVPFMKVHGHGVPRFYLPTVTSSAPSLLQVVNLGFTMAGPWEIVVTAKVNGQLDVAEIPVEVP